MSRINVTQLNSALLLVNSAHFNSTKDRVLFESHVITSRQFDNRQYLDVRGLRAIETSFSVEQFINIGDYDYSHQNIISSNQYENVKVSAAYSAIREIDNTYLNLMVGSAEFSWSNHKRELIIYRSVSENITGNPFTDIPQSSHIVFSHKLEPITNSVMTQEEIDKFHNEFKEKVRSTIVKNLKRASEENNHEQ